MSITMKHPNGTVWEAAQREIKGASCYVLSNKNPLGHRDPNDGTDERGNEERFHIYCPDVKSVINGLQMGLSIRMKGVGDNGKVQTNLFKADNILIGNKPVMTVAP